MSLTRWQHTALLRISSLLGEALASTTSLPASLEMTGFSTMVAVRLAAPKVMSRVKHYRCGLVYVKHYKAVRSQMTAAVQLHTVTGQVIIVQKLLINYQSNLLVSASQI